MYAMNKKNGAKYVFFCSNNYAVDEPIEIRMSCEKGRGVFGYDDACLGKAPLDMRGEEALKTHRMICVIYKTGRKFL